MKKLVVLLLVVGLASVSFGGLVAVPNVTDITASLSGNILTIGGAVAPAAGTSWAFGVGYDGSIATVAASGTVLAAAGQFGSLNTFPATSPTGFDVGAGDGGGTAATTGPWVTVVVSGVTSSSHLTIWDYKLSADGTDIGQIAVPEPITMALLGLGGLFIRRKTA